MLWAVWPARSGRPPSHQGGFKMVSPIWRGGIDLRGQVDYLFFVRVILIGVIRIRLVPLRLLFLLFLRLYGFKKDLIREAQLHRLLRVHPGLILHELGDPVVGKAGLKGIGVDDALLDLVERRDGSLHVFGIAHGNGAGIVDHQHGNRGT